MAKYAPLENYLETNGKTHVPMTFADIESIIGDNLPQSARKHRAWWSNNPSNSVITYAWLSAGYKTAQVDMGGEKLVFLRAATLPTAPPKSSPHLPNSGSATHALIGAMRETVTVSAGVDLTQPTGVKWEAEIT